MSRLNELVKNIGSNCDCLRDIHPHSILSQSLHCSSSRRHRLWRLDPRHLLDFTPRPAGFGDAGAITRFVSRNHAQGDHEEASRAVSAGLWLRLWVAFLIVAISAVLSALAPVVLHIPPELKMAARGAMLLVGASFALTLACGVFGAVLVALNRFSYVSGLTVAQTLLRAVGVVWLLTSGRGILSLAIWEFAVAVLINITLFVLCSRTYPQLQIFSRSQMPSYFDNL